MTYFIVWVVVFVALAAILSVSSNITFYGLNLRDNSRTPPTRFARHVSVYVTTATFLAGAMWVLLGLMGLFASLAYMIKH